MIFRTKHNQYPVLTETINNTEISIAGVEHRRGFFKRNKKKFRRFVKENDAIVMEQLIEGEFWEHPQFFARVAKIAHSQGKPIYNIDPITPTLDDMDIAQSYTAPSILVATAALALQRAAERKFSRRHFLKLTGITTLLTPFTLGSDAGVDLRADIDEEAVMQHGLDDTLSYGAIDYRNLVIADGTVRLLDLSPEIRKIGLIHGAYHYGSIQGYLTNPNLRKKRILYIPFDLVSRTKIRKYVPDGKNWKLETSF
jgi:hypothetical protein